MSVHIRAVEIVRWPYVRPGLVSLLLAGAVVIAVAAATAISALPVRDAGTPAESPILRSNQATLSRPSVFYLVRPEQTQGLDVAERLAGAPFENLVVVATKDDEERFLRFIETANSFLLAGGLPGYEVENLFSP